jgi:hypothetical protein
MESDNIASSFFSMGAMRNSLGSVCTCSGIKDGDLPRSYSFHQNLHEYFLRGGLKRHAHVPTSSMGGGLGIVAKEISAAKLALSAKWIFTCVIRNRKKTNNLGGRRSRTGQNDLVELP